MFKEMGSWQQYNSPPEEPAESRDQPQHHTPDTHLPFGCTTTTPDSAMNPYLPSPVDTVIDMHRDIFHDNDFAAPMPGQSSLFTNVENDYIQNFFRGISGSEPGQENNFGEGLTFSNEWLNMFPQHQQAPPAVLGAQIHPSDTSMDSILSSFTFEPVLHPTFDSAPSMHVAPDVLGAAQALSRPPGPSNDQYHHALPTRVQPNMGTPVGSVPSPQYSHYVNGQRHNSVVNHQMMPNGYPNMYASISPGLPPNPRAVPHPEIHFGTDRNFTGGSFNPTEGNIEGRIFQHQDSILGCLQPNTSAAPTRASSPQPNGLPAEAKSPLKLRTTQEFAIPIKTENEPAKKRRKSKPKSPEANEVAEFSPDAPTMPIARITSGSIGSIPESAVLNESSPVDDAQPPPSAGTKRRRGTGAAKKATKPPRQNLSDEQKRENHIKSEQKRRSQIKEAFDDVMELVPDLKNNGLSKSVILNTTADYLTRLTKENGELKEHLARHGVPFQ